MFNFVVMLLEDVFLKPSNEAVRFVSQLQNQCYKEWCAFRINDFNRILHFKVSFAL